jgi:glycosyl transferase family 25
MKIFVIHLRRLSERLAFIEAGLSSLGVDYEIFSAIDGVKGEYPRSRYDEAACRRNFGAALLPGELGAFASHYALWQSCVDGGQPIAVMEDDVELSPRFPEALAAADSLIIKHGFVRLAGYYMRPFRLVETVNETHQLVRFLRGPAGAQCYCLSPAAAVALLAGADQWVEPVDLYLDRFWQHGVQSKALLPFEAWEKERTHLPQAIGDRTTHRHGFAKCRRELNRIKDDVARSIYNATHH